MAITNSDVKIFESQRLTDEEDSEALTFEERYIITMNSHRLSFSSSEKKPPA